MFGQILGLLHIMFFGPLFRGDCIDKVTVETDAVEFWINLGSDDNRGINHIAQQIFCMARGINVDMQFRESFPQFGEARDKAL